jgi:hypothetical protein
LNVSEITFKTESIKNIFGKTEYTVHYFIFIFIYLFFFIDPIINQQSTISNCAGLCGLYIGCAELCGIVRTVRTVRNFSKIFCAHFYKIYVRNFISHVQAHVPHYENNTLGCVAAMLLHSRRHLFFFIKRINEFFF